MEKRILIQAVFSLAFLMFFTTSSISQCDERKELHLDAAGIEHDAQMVNIRLDRGKNAIFLDDTELIEDDGPATGVPQEFGEGSTDYIEYLKKGIVIKKLLVLENPAANSGRLVFLGDEVKGNREPLHISLNGIEFIRPAARFSYPFARQYIDLSFGNRWFFVDLPVGALKKGENEVLMWVNSDSTSWKVLITDEKEFARGSLTRTHHPNRSLKSSDGGKTWSDSRLCSKDSIDGEYSVRFSLDRHVGSGQYTSPVIDCVDDRNPLKRTARITGFKYTLGIDVPEGTSAGVQTRFGASPRTDDPSWTPWGTAETGKEVSDLGNRRYFQWRVDLSTQNPLKTPVIKDFVLSARWEDLSPNKEVGIDVEVVHNGHVARSSYPFGYENILHPELEKYRKNAKLDKIVEGSASEFELMMRLLNWAYRIPVASEQYSWNWNDVVSIQKGEQGMPRLQTDYKGRRRDAMCLYSNQALIGALLAFGHQARHININSEAVSGHEVTEVWSNEFNKWIYLDATRDYYYFDKITGIPLNLLENHNLLAEQMPRVETWDRPFVPEMGKEIVDKIDIGIRQGVNQFSAEPDGRHILEIIGHFRIIPRNDFLSHPVPVPVHTGATMWGWSGFLNYYDEKFPKRYEYQTYSNRALDFYEPLNQSELYLNETAERGVLNVEVNTFTPGFDTFLVRLNDGKWVEQKQPVWLWALKAGKNCLEVRARNARGVLGPISMMNVTYNP
ncbi:MAG: hypothetical protein WCU00_07465 [Candidatus Latescibacterota bacterium]